MPVYRLYFLSNPSGSIERFEEFEATDDDEALAIIDQQIGDRPLELWSDRRKVGQFDTALALSGITSAGLWAETLPEPQPRRLFNF